MKPGPAGAVVFTDGSRVTRYSVKGDTERLCWELAGEEPFTEVFRHGILVERVSKTVTERFVYDTKPDFRSLKPGRYVLAGRALDRGRIWYRFHLTSNAAERIREIVVAGRKHRAIEMTDNVRMTGWAGGRETWHQTTAMGLSSHLPLHYSLRGVDAAGAAHAETYRAKSVYVPGVIGRPPKRGHACQNGVV